MDEIQMGLPQTRTQLPSWVSTLFSPFKTQTHQNPFSESSIFVLNHVDISLLSSICGKECLLHLGSSIHSSVIKNSELDLNNQDSARSALVVRSSLLFMYSKCGELSNAVKLFDRMPVKDIVSWNTAMSGFLRNGEFDMGFGLFKRMRDLGLFQFDKATLTTILSACEGPEYCYVSKMVHGLVIYNGFLLHGRKVQRLLLSLESVIIGAYACPCNSSHWSEAMHLSNIDPQWSFSSQILTIPFLWQFFSYLKEAADLAAVTAFLLEALPSIIIQ